MTTPEGATSEGTTPEGRTIVEEMKLQGHQVLGQLSDLIHEGNVRRITIKNDEGRVVIEIPLTIGVAGALLVPTLAAVGAVAALLTDCSIEVVKVMDTPPAGTEEPVGG